MARQFNFNKRIVFKKQDEEGNYYDVCEAWADIRTLSSKQMLEAKAVQAKITHEIHIRYRPGIDRSLTVFLGNKELKIITPPIDIDGKRKIIRFTCREMGL